MRGRLHKRFFDTANTGPPLHKRRAARFVVCSASARATEWLLPNHGTCAFVVDVEVSCAIAKCC